MQSLTWSSLHHAYGSAADIPALLVAAGRAPAPSGHRDEPWHSLWSALCHQGDVYTASYAAVPELIAIAEARAAEPRVMRECLLLAASIELERGLPEGAPPPAIPADIARAYHAGLARGAELASRGIGETADSAAARALAMSLAAFRGDLAEARLLADGPADADTP